MTQNAEQIAWLNFNAAVDQVDAYENLTAAFEAYQENAQIDAAENRVDISDTMSFFEKFASDHDEAAFQAMWTI